jgi:hypothetical protein
MDLFGLFSSAKPDTPQETSFLVVTEQPPVSQIDTLKLRALSGEYSEALPPSMLTSSSQVIVKKGSHLLDTDPVAQAFTHPFIREKIETTALEDYHVRHLYDHFYCKMNANRTDPGFQYVKDKVCQGIGFSKKPATDDISYHAHELAQFQPIQLRVDLVNQTLADYINCDQLIKVKKPEIEIEID